MNAQQRFQYALEAQQSRSATPNKMPYLCVVGQLDFDELRAEILTQFEAMKLDEFDPDPERPTFDLRQLGSLTDSLEYCGCKCFRALYHKRSFIFA